MVQHGEKEPTPGDPALTRVGIEQAKTTAKWLAENVSIGALWSSPYRRARETATPIAELFGLEVAVDPRLRERMNWDGTTETTDEFFADWQRASADRWYVPRSGDSSIDAAARFLDALTDISRAGAQASAVVAHGGITTDALRTILGDEELLAQAPALIEQGVPCCALTTLVTDGGAWTADSIAVTDHLSGG